MKDDKSTNDARPDAFIDRAAFEQYLDERFRAERPKVLAAIEQSWRQWLRRQS